MKFSKLFCLMLSATAIGGCEILDLAQASKATFASSATPQAPIGYEWQVVEGMTDEFSGNQLDTSKWQDHIKTWQGRPPAEFLPENISVSDGFLKVKTSTHPSPNDTYTMAGAAVKGLQQKRYGYYETKLKASKVRMSTTFWLHSDGHEDVARGCDKQHSIEIDILEAIGGWYNDTWTNVMHSNTHYKSYELDENGNCVRSKYLSKGAKKDTGHNLSDGFHTFAAWWVSPNLVHYYFDGELTGTVEVSHDKDRSPFDGPMSLRMVAETYSWQGKYAPEGKPPYPSEQELDDDTINTIYYDYVRSFELVPVKSNLTQQGDFEQTLDNNWTLNNAGLTALPEYSYTHGQALRVIPNGEAKTGIKAINGKALSVTFYAKLIGSNADLNSATVKVVNSNGIVVASANIASKSFQPYRLEVPAQSGEFELIITNQGLNSVTIDTLAVLAKD